MNIEIVDFFEEYRDNERDILRGTLHAYLCDLKVDLRGIFVSKRRNSWFIGLPMRTGKDHETGEPVRYPVFSFMDRAKTAELLSQMREKGKIYIEQNVLKQKIHSYGNIN